MIYNVGTRLQVSYIKVTTCYEYKKMHNYKTPPINVLVWHSFKSFKVISLNQWSYMLIWCNSTSKLFKKN